MITIQRDVGDILDRWAIAKLKSERIGTEENHKEFIAFEEARVQLKEKYNNFDIEFCSKLILMINDFIWQLEAGLKSGKEELPKPHYLLDDDNKEVLAKIGFTSMLIRNYNSVRVALKNFINSSLQDGFIDIKKGHLSE